MLLGGGAALVAGCSQQPSKFKTYNGPEVTRLVAFKQARELHVMHHGRRLETYRFQLGFAPVGHKQFEGDGKTPEGEYIIDRRNPNSAFHLSIGISYPNEADREFARAMGRSPGGDIFIHGTPRRYVNKPDWTAGCIAVMDSEMEDIYAMVRDGTPIAIYA